MSLHNRFHTAVYLGVIIIKCLQYLSIVVALPEYEAQC